jgi:hypothetical protein
LLGILAVVVVVAIGASTYNAFAAPAEQQSNVATGWGNGSGRGNGNGANGTGNGGSTGPDIQQLQSIPASELSADEAAGLLFMREEEKLARDVYNQLYSLWGQQMFQNIASSEQTHMDQVKLLIDRYALADPALAVGKFTDPNLQTLYDQLIAQGSVSLTEALKVGALVEQTDINDLQSHLAETDNGDIQLVYNNLMSASYNHLNAFTSGGGQGGGRGNGHGYGKGNTNP